MFDEQGLEYLIFNQTFFRKLTSQGFLRCQTPTPTVRLKVKGCRVKNGGCRIESDKTLGVGLKEQSGGCRTQSEEERVWA